MSARVLVFMPLWTPSDHHRYQFTRYEYEYEYEYE